MTNVEMSLFITFSAVKYRVLSIDIFRVKITSCCDVTSCIAHCIQELKETCSKTKENAINRKFNAFDVEYRIYFIRATGFLQKCFHSCFTFVKYQKILSHS